MRTHLSILPCLLLLGCADAHEGDMRQTILAPLGLVTQPNDAGQYPPGALQTAHNVVMRDLGLVESMYEPLNWSSEDIAASTSYVRRLVDAGYLDGTDPVLFAMSETVAGGTFTLEWFTADDKGTIPLPTAVLVTYAEGRFHVVKHRGAWYLTSESGVLRIDADPTADTALRAGLPPPEELDSSGSTSTGAQAIDNNKDVAYRAVFVRRNADDVITMISPPGYSMLYVNTTGATIDPDIVVRWSDHVDLVAGTDTVEIYRTKAQDTGTDPGATYLLAASFELTATEISAQEVTITDRTSDAGLGAALYTNSDEEAAKFPPGLARDVTIFQDRAFYIMTEEASAHTVRIPGDWGTLSSAAQKKSGIGSRSFTADYASASNALTSISDTTGLVAGMSVTSADFPNSTTVTSVDTGAGTAVLSDNSTAPGTGAAMTWTDRIEINGDVTPMGRPIDSGGASADGLIGGPPDSNEVIVLSSEKLPVTPAIVTGTELRFLMPYHHLGAVTLRATNGGNYDPQLPEIADTVFTAGFDARDNRLRISDEGQPSAVSSNEGTELLVGGGDLHRVIAAADAVYVFASDGLYKVTGSFPGWFVDEVDPTLVLAAGDAVDVMRDTIYAYTDRGLVRIRGDVVQEVSEGLIADELPGQAFETTWDIEVKCDQANREVHVLDRAQSKGWIFNEVTQRFTTTDYGIQNVAGTPRALVYIASERQMVWALKVTSGGGNRVYGPDTADADSAMEGAEVIFQPVYGDGDPFTLKEWTDATYRFEVFASGLEVHPEFNGEDQSAYPAYIPGSSGKQRVSAEVGLDAALAESMAPGFTVTHLVSGANVSHFKFFGMSLRYRIASEEAHQEAAQ